MFTDTLKPPFPSDPTVNLLDDEGLLQLFGAKPQQLLLTTG